MMYVMCLFQRLSQYSDEAVASKSDLQVGITVNDIEIKNNTILI